MAELLTVLGLLLLAVSVSAGGDGMDTPTKPPHLGKTICSADPSYIPNTDCPANNMRIYYDAQSKTCKTYPVGSCVTSANRFLVPGGCNRKCVRGKVTTEAPTTRRPVKEFPCRCWVEGDPMAETFDKTIKLIIDPQTTLLSRGQNPDRYDRCRYEVTAETDDNYPSKHGQVYVNSVSFSFGLHETSSVWFERTIKITQTDITALAHGMSPQTVAAPWWYTTTYNPSGDAIHVNVYTLGNTVTIESDDCPWKLTFVRGGFESKIHFSVGDRYKPDNNGGQSMDGLCGNCDGVYDYVLCGAGRTDVSQEEDKYRQISESCAENTDQG